MTKQETDETMRKVLNWLTEEGIYRDKISDEQANYHFKIESPTGSGRIADIVQPKQRDDLILVISGVSLAKEHSDGLKSKSKKEREDILWDMRFELLFRNSDFSMIPSAEELQTIQFIRPLHFEGLTKNVLMDAIREDWKCHLFVVWKMQRLFGAAPPKTPETMYG
jgi:hypothetical protein